MTRVTRAITANPKRPRSEPADHARHAADLLAEPEAVWDDEERFEHIAENAYYRAERRGFLPGFELGDWLAAEQEIDESRKKAP